MEKEVIKKKIKELEERLRQKRMHKTQAQALVRSYEIDIASIEGALDEFRKMMEGERG